LIQGVVQNDHLGVMLNLGLMEIRLVSASIFVLAHVILVYPPFLKYIDIHLFIMIT